MIHATHMASGAVCHAIEGPEFNIFQLKDYFRAHFTRTVLHALVLWPGILSPQSLQVAPTVLGLATPTVIADLT